MRLAPSLRIPYKPVHRPPLQRPNRRAEAVKTMGEARNAGAAGDVTASERYGPHAALVVVDVQNDFADPGGSLSVKGGDAIVPVVNAEVERAIAAGSLVVYTQDWHPAHTPHFAQDGGIWPVHCVQESWGAELHPGLRVAGQVVRKGQHGEDGYSGFTMRDPVAGHTVPTELDGVLAEAGARVVIVCGLATDYCVKATALDAVRLGYSTAVLLPAIRAVDLQPGDGERAVEEMVGAGVTLLDVPAGNAAR
jgi:nicotinamidase/pyrazinamidase